MERLSLYQTVDALRAKPRGCHYATGERTPYGHGFQVRSWHRTFEGCEKAAKRMIRNGSGRTLMAEDDR